MPSYELTGAPKFYPAVDSTTRHSTPKTGIGSRAFSAEDGGEFVYVTAGGAITTSGDPVSINGALSAVVRGASGTGAFLGCADAPFASGESGYVRVKGPASMVVESGAVAGGELQLSGTAGKLKALTTSGTAVAIALAASDDAGAARIAVHLLGR